MNAYEANNEGAIEEATLAIKYAKSVVGGQVLNLGLEGRRSPSLNNVYDLLTRAYVEYCRITGQEVEDERRTVLLEA